MSGAHDLAQQLEEKTSALSRRCTHAMYRDPFWQARFGERGRRYAEEDSAYHVKYLASALRADEAAVFTNYARWLRGILSARGMCSLHLAQSFRQLARAMDEEQVEGADPAKALLQAGEQALRYETGDASPLEAGAAEVAEHARTVLGPRAYRLDELLSFLLDAVAREDAQSLAKHVTFLDDTLTQGPDERHMLRLTLDALRDSALPRLPAEAQASLAALLEPLAAG